MTEELLQGKLSKDSRSCLENLLQLIHSEIESRTADDGGGTERGLILLFAAAFVRDHVVEMRASIKSFPEPVRRSSHFRNHRSTSALACWFAGSLLFRQVILWRSFGILDGRTERWLRFRSWSKLMKGGITATRSISATVAS
jgi:hypothetical protein